MPASSTLTSSSIFIPVSLLPAAVLIVSLSACAQGNQRNELARGNKVVTSASLRPIEQFGIFARERIYFGQSSKVYGGHVGSAGQIIAASNARVTPAVNSPVNLQVEPVKKETTGSWRPVPPIRLHPSSPFLTVPIKPLPVNGAGKGSEKYCKRPGNIVHARAGTDQQSQGGGSKNGGEADMWRYGANRADEKRLTSTGYGAPSPMNTFAARRYHMHCAETTEKPSNR